MVYFTIFFILFLIFILFIPNRIGLFINDKYVMVSIFKVTVFKMNFTDTADYAIEQVKHYHPKWSDLEYLRILRKIKFVSFDINIGNVIEDYVSKNIAISQLYATFGFLRLLLPHNKYYLQITRNNANYFSFKSIFYFKVGKILVTIFSLRRKIYARTSNK